jgi:hypothetical protein
MLKNSFLLFTLFTLLSSNLSCRFFSNSYASSLNMNAWVSYLNGTLALESSFILSCGSSLLVTPILYTSFPNDPMLEMMYTYPAPVSCFLVSMFSISWLLFCSACFSSSISCFSFSFSSSEVVFSSVSVFLVMSVSIFSFSLVYLFFSLSNFFCIFASSFCFSRSSLSICFSSSFFSWYSYAMFSSSSFKFK